MDHDGSQWKEADAYLIEWRLEGVPKRTWENSGDKPWIFFALEPPEIVTSLGVYNWCPHCVGRWNWKEYMLRHSFNYTATYHYDASFPWPYWTYEDLISTWIGKKN